MLTCFFRSYTLSYLCTPTNVRTKNIPTFFEVCLRVESFSTRRKEAEISLFCLFVFTVSDKLADERFIGDKLTWNGRYFGEHVKKLGEPRMHFLVIREGGWQKALVGTKLICKKGVYVKSSIFCCRFRADSRRKASCSSLVCSGWK